jgi:Sec-independent protein translocase protein TatA
MEIEMHRRPFAGSRNKLDLGNPVQVRIVRKRLKISKEQLNNLVRKAGDSIAAVRKEAGSRQVLKLPQANLNQAHRNQAQLPAHAVTAQNETTETQQALV